MNKNLMILAAIFLIGHSAQADKAASPGPNNGGSGSSAAKSRGFVPANAYSTEGLLTPDQDQSLWGLGTIPSVGHLEKTLSGRRRGDFCGQEYQRLQAMQKKIYPSQIPKSISVLRNAVKPFGISQKMLDRTLAVFLRNQTLIPNQRFVTIFDHTQPSTAKRFVVLDLWNGTAKGYRSAHGSGSDPKHKGKGQRGLFSNKSGTNQSSLGCALANHKYRAKVTRQEPKGRWALSILGFESTNDNSCDRGVYMHAAAYVDYEKNVRGSEPGYAKRPGRSWGCPAFTYAERDEVFNQIDGGGLVCSFGE